MKKTNKLTISILLGVMCIFLSAGIFVQIKTVNESTQTVGRTQMENGLRDSALRWKEKYENAYAKLEKKEKELEMARKNVANLDGSSSSLNDKLLKYNTLLGYTDVKGQGIIITLDDGDAAGLKGLGASSYIVHDGDIREIINELKNAGAEAISVNGQRITARTAVSCIGNVVKINDQKVGAPFVIKAIGPTTMLYGAMTRAGGYAEILEIDYGVKVKIERVEKEIIEIPKYEGVYEQNYASNVE